MNACLEHNAYTIFLWYQLICKLYLFRYRLDSWLLVNMGFVTVAVYQPSLTNESGIFGISGLCWCNPVLTST